MTNAVGAKPDYGSWVSKRIICVPAALGLFFLGLSFAFPVLIAPGLFFSAICAYFAYARRLFSPAGENIQSRILDMVPAHLDWDGRGQALDIGCGNGPLAIMLARRYPGARVTGIDSWGPRWEYAQSVCARNAEIEGVASRVKFQKASAADLPFANESFDAAVSNLVFHEVREAPDKRDLIREALRVVKTGGPFAFQDLFQLKRLYGNADDLPALLKSWGIAEAAFLKTSDRASIPAALMLPFMIGGIGILYGKK